MELYLNFRTYNIFGGDPRYGWISLFLLSGAPDFGPAIREIELIFCCPVFGPPENPSLQKLLADYIEHRAKLPLVTFQRSREKMTIQAACDSVRLQHGSERPDRSLPEPQVLISFLDEVLAALKLMRAKLKKSDSFDLEAFIAHVENSKNRLPREAAGLNQLVKSLRAEEEAERKARSEWDLLAIEWRDFHPGSRALLDDPFLWDCADEFAPHGNDIGADLLSAFQEWHEDYPEGDSLDFFCKVVKGWGYPKLEEVDAQTRNQGLVALAFAELKLRGHCSTPVRNMALESISLQRHEAENSDPSWKFRQECLDALDKVEARLCSAPVVS